MQAIFRTKVYKKMS